MTTRFASLRPEDRRPLERSAIVSSPVSTSRLPDAGPRRPFACNRRRLSDSTPKARAKASPLPLIGIVPVVGPGLVDDVVEQWEIDSCEAWWKVPEARREFVLRLDGHSDRVAARLGDGLMLRKFGSLAFPLVIWTPDASNLEHRAAVEMIRAGRVGVSAEFRTLRRTFRGGQRVIQEAEPRGVVLCPTTSSPCYRAAGCGVLDSHLDLERSIWQLVGNAHLRVRAEFPNWE
jgi:hypothetical protein